MKKNIRRFLIFIAVMLAGVVTFAVWPTTTKNLTMDESYLKKPEVIEQGKYLAVLGDCAACHSKDSGKTYTGGNAIESPIGNMYSPNITPDNETGIGKYTLDDFDRALRYGIRKDGVSLYPAMPYPSYAKISDDDVIALYAYFKYGVEPINQASAENEIPWPLSIRFPMTFWRKIFAPNVEPISESKYSDAKVARGAYLVQGLAHCGACHTPRAITMQEIGLDESSPEFLAGETLIDGWVAINLLNNDDGLKNWNEEDIVGSLSMGKNKKGAVLGSPMNEFIHESGQHITPEDLSAMVAYLKTLPAKHEDQPKFVVEERNLKPEKTAVGFDLYRKNCVACHGMKGDGNKGKYPELSANPTVLATNPQSVIRVTLEGSEHATVNESAKRESMKNFAEKFSDQEVADISTFIRSHWGNKAPAVSAEEVKKIREKYINN